MEPRFPTDSDLRERVCGDARLSAFIERVVGVSPRDFPVEGMEIRDTPQRFEKAGEYLMIRRIGSGAVITAIPRVLEAIAPFLDRLSPWELFTSYGMDELRRALPLDVSHTLVEIFHYTLLNFDEFRPAESSVRVERLLPDGYRVDDKEEDAFATFDGKERIAVASVRSPLPGYIFLSVETKKAYQGKGHATAAVSAAAQWILEQGAVAHYGVRAPNTPSIRIARRLGFVLTSQMIIA